MHLITGKCGTDHITSANEGFKNSQIFGEGNYIFDADGDFFARKISDNTIRISRGQGMMQGRAFELLEDTDLAIMNGTTALKRKDLIVARYSKNPNTDIESIDLVVLTGTRSVDEPTRPSFIEGNILAGDLQADFPLYEIYINGTEIQTVTALFQLQAGLVEEVRVKVGTASLETSASNLSDAINELYDELFYKDGETLITDSIWVGGTISGSARSVYFSIPLKKRLDNINSIDITSCLAGIRTIDGKLLNNSTVSYEWVGQENIAVTVRVISKETNAIVIRITTSGTYTNAPANNTPLGIEVKVGLTLHSSTGRSSTEPDSTQGR